MTNKYKQIVYFFIFFNLNFVFSQTMSLEQARKAKVEYERIKKNSQTLQKPLNDNALNESTGGTPQMGRVNLYKETKSLSTSASNYYYGYDFFTLRDSIPFWENLPTPNSYLLGPGDELIVVSWGETQFRYSYVISREGTIFDDKVGLLNIMGKSIEEAEKY